MSDPHVDQVRLANALAKAENLSKEVRELSGKLEASERQGAGMRVELLAIQDILKTSMSGEVAFLLAERGTSKRVSAVLDVTPELLQGESVSTPELLYTDAEVREVAREWETSGELTMDAILARIRARRSK